MEMGYRISVNTMLGRTLASGTTPFLISIFIFSVVDTSIIDGGIALDTIMDFTTNGDAIFDLNEDVLDLTGFFSYWGTNVDENNVGDYLRINGSDIQIDPDGPGSVFWGSSPWTTIATLNGTSDTFTNVDLSSMVAAGQIVL